MQGKTSNDKESATPRDAATPSSAGETRKATTDFSGRRVMDLLPQLDKVKVSVGGVSVPRDPRHAHGYDILVSGAAATVAFYGYYKPRKGETVVVEYEHQDY